MFNVGIVELSLVEVVVISSRDQDRDKRVQTELVMIERQHRIAYKGAADDEGVILTAIVQVLCYKIIDVEEIQLLSHAFAVSVGKDFNLSRRQYRVEHGADRVRQGNPHGIRSLQAQGGL